MLCPLSARVDHLKSLPHDALLSHTTTKNATFLLLGCSHIDSMWHFHQEHATYFIPHTATCCRRELSLTSQSRGQKEVEWRRVRDGGLRGLTVFCHLLWLYCIVQAPNPLPWQWYFLIHGAGICDHTSSLKKKKSLWHKWLVKCQAGGKKCVTCYKLCLLWIQSMIGCSLSQSGSAKHGVAVAVFMLVKGFHSWILPKHFFFFQP